MPEKHPVETSPEALPVDPVAVGPTLAAGSSPASPVAAGAPSRSTTDYVVGDELARGGMGRILAGHDRRLGRPVAIKELLGDASDLRTRFEREVAITARLQHPGIVSLLDAGAWPSGEPFYAMKLVKGRSLAVAIAETRTLSERLALLPNVIAVVDALAYAHAQRIIHRDLKPENVLVGAYGETVVIDWGLAKDLADGASEPAAPARTTAAGSDATVAGAIVGTPACMPPEQARGAAVDQRADVYALGAMLYHLLAGGPPYSGPSVDDVLDEVIAGPPRPLVERVPGVPRDLATIVGKAMARRADDRYHDAAELAVDLKRFQTGQLVASHHYSPRQLITRWLRRHKAPVAVALVALAVVATLGAISLRRIVREQEKAAAQATLAEQRRGEAEDLLDFMIFDLRDKLGPIGRLELLGAVAEKASAYYRKQGSLDAESLYHRGVALDNVGEVFRAQGNATDAAARYREALALAPPGPQLDPRWQSLVIQLHRHLASALAELGDGGGARREIGLALALTEGPLALSPRDPLLLSRLAQVHTQRGNMLFDQHEYAEAMVSYRAVIDADTTLLAVEPSDANRYGLADDHSNLGRALLGARDLKGAEAELRLALGIQQQAAQADPKNVERLSNLAKLHGSLGHTLELAGRLDEARAELELAHTLGERVVALDPSNASWQLTLAASEQHLGAIALARGDGPGALAAYQRMVDICRRQSTLYPENAAWQNYLSTALEQLGNLEAGRGRGPEALAYYREALALVEKAMARDQTSMDWRFSAMSLHDEIGRVHAEGGDLDRALAEYRAGVAVIERKAVEGHADWMHALASLDDVIGDVLMQKKDLAGAEAAYRLSYAAVLELERQQPDNPESGSDVATLAESLGDCLAAQGRAEEARALWQEALSRVKKLPAPDAEWTRGLEKKLRH